MLVFQRSSDLQPGLDSQDFDWTRGAQSYPNIEEAPTFITSQRQAASERVGRSSASPQNLVGTQLKVYSAVKDHFDNNYSTPLHIIVTGTAAYGCCWLIN